VTKAPAELPRTILLIVGSENLSNIVDGLHHSVTISPWVR